MMNDCKITKEFIRLESRKRSYCNIVNLVIPSEKDPEILITPAEIRNKKAEQFQDIFNKQDIDNDTDFIADLVLEDDTLNLMKNCSADNFQKN